MPKHIHLGYNFTINSYLESVIYMKNQLLKDADWAGMRNSVEVRLPFVDSDLAKFVFNSSSDKRYSKQGLIDCLPGEIRSNLSRRKKLGFSVLFSDWMLKDKRCDKSLSNRSLIMSDKISDFFFND